jgi:hypothetical protein
MATQYLAGSKATYTGPGVLKGLEAELLNDTCAECTDRVNVVFKDKDNPKLTYSTKVKMTDLKFTETIQSDF